MRFIPSSTTAGVTVLVVQLSSFATSAESQRTWQEGTCRDVTTDSRVVSFYSSGSAVGNTVSGSTVPISVVHAYYVIETADMIYIGSHRLRWRWSKPIDLTINRPVRFAIEKRNMYLQDDEGKEHKLDLVKRIARDK